MWSNAGIPMRWLIAFGAVVGAAVTIAFAAQQPPAQPTFRTGVDVVQVDVSVLDKDRKPIRGLTTADFTILEDGKPRPIVAFVPVDLDQPERTAAPAAWVREVSPDVVTNAVKPEGRLVVIMFDWSIRFMDQVLARRIAVAAVDELGPDDLAAVIFSSGFANAGSPQNFTADRALLLAAINRPIAPVMQNPPKGVPGHDPRNNNDLMIDDPEGYESGDCYCRLCVAEAIARVADAVRDIRGRRKTLLFIGSYFRIYESLQGPVSRQGKPLEPGAPVYHAGVCSAPLKDAREKMTRATSLANLAVHTLDPVGMETAGNSPLGGGLDAIRERQDDLKLLADITGGRTVMSTNAPEALLPAVFAESQSYYLLAFAPADRSAEWQIPQDRGESESARHERSNALGLLRRRNAGGREQAEHRVSGSRGGDGRRAAAHRRSAQRERRPLRSAREGRSRGCGRARRPPASSGGSFRFQPARQGAGGCVRPQRTIGSFCRADGGNRLTGECGW